MEYREFQPPAALAPWVTALWTLRGVVERPAFELVLPDGRAELIVHRRGRFLQGHADGSATRQARSLVAGVTEHAVALSPDGDVETIGIRLEPYAQARLCEVRLDALGGEIVAADEVIVAPLAGVLAKASAADSCRGAIDILQRGLQHRFARAAAPPRQVVDAVRRIRQSGGTISIDRAARESELGDRALQRQFRQLVGVSAKRYARVVRFHCALSATIASGARGADVAVRCGYYDQAHLIRDFKAFTGWAPCAFLNGRVGELTRHFAGNAPVGFIQDESASTG